MTAPEVRTPGGSRASAEELGNSSAIVTVTAAFDKPDDDHKAFASMAARAALCGAGLYRLADGELLLTRWGYAKTCPDLRSVAALLSRMTTGGQR